jgi:DNA end-binding protein Ku
MNIEKFIDTGSIDPVYYDAAYYAAPDGDAGRDVYAVLREAIAKTGKTALVISQRERTIAMRPTGDGLFARTLYEERDLNIAKDLFDVLSGPASSCSASQAVMMRPISRIDMRSDCGR